MKITTFQELADYLGADGTGEEQLSEAVGEVVPGAWLAIVDTAETVTVWECWQATIRFDEQAEVVRVLSARFDPADGETEPGPFVEPADLPEKVRDHLLLLNQGGEWFIDSVTPNKLRHYIANNAALDVTDGDEDGTRILFFECDVERPTGKQVQAIVLGGQADAGQFDGINTSTFQLAFPFNDRRLEAVLTLIDQGLEELREEYS